MSYEVIRSMGKVLSLLRSDGVSVPVNAPDNRDWREFLAWNAAQDVPLSLNDTEPTEAETAAQLVAEKREANRATLAREKPRVLAELATIHAEAASANSVQILRVRVAELAAIVKTIVEAW